MPLNAYGDQKIETTGTHGADIAAQRVDDLDRACLQHILDTVPMQGAALDLGAGSGYHTLRMAALGVEAISVDLLDLTPRYERLREAFPSLNLRHDCGRIEDFVAEQNRLPLSLIYSQRTFHYVPFSETVRVFQDLQHWALTNSKVFISVSGLESELGDDYPDRTTHIDARWSTLTPAMAEKHGILQPVCLYREDDVAHLADLSGFTPKTIWSSEFGNVKAILEKT